MKLYLYSIMSYIVSARKYRPKTFNEVVGQDQIIQTLVRAIDSDHLAQAFLFCGPRGVGKTTMARILAKSVNAGKVEGLDQVDEDFSFNIFELDAASNNKVDDIHQLIAQVRIPPQTGKYKIYIIDEVHMLSQAAFNAFLKTLEEPPPYAIFILATTEKHKILPTILSRCQIYDFKRISVSDMVTHLKQIAKKEAVEVDEMALHIVAEKADGALRDALSIFDRLVSSSGEKLTYEDAVKSLNVLDYDYFFKITDTLLAEDTSSAFLIFNEVLQNGFEGNQFMLGLSSHYRNILVCKDPKTCELLEVSDILKEKYMHQASITPSSFLVNALALTSDCDIQYAQSQNKRLLVELTLIKIAYLSRVFSPRQIVEKPEMPVQPLQKNPIEKAQSPIVQKEKSSLDEVKPENKQSTTEENNDNTSSLEPEKKETSSAQSSKFSLQALEEELKEEPVSEKQHSETEVGEKEDQTKASFSEVTETQMQEAWNSLIAELKEKEILSLHDILNDKKPVLQEDKVVLTVDSEVEKGLVQKDIDKISNILRRQLHVGQIFIEIQVSQNEESKKVILTEKDKYDRMVKKNPMLKEFKDQLGLELDY